MIMEWNGMDRITYLECQYRDVCYYRECNVGGVCAYARADRSSKTIEESDYIDDNRSFSTVPAQARRFSSYYIPFSIWIWLFLRIMFAVELGINVVKIIFV